MPMGSTLTAILRHYLKIQRPTISWFPVFGGIRLRETGSTWCLIKCTVAEQSNGLSNMPPNWRYQKPVNVHSLRHTFATHLLEDGVNILTIKELLGHASIRTTMIYLHVAQVDNRQRRSPLIRNGVEVIKENQGNFL